MEVRELREIKAVVHATIALAHELGKRVVGEGVEDQARLEALREAGCDLVQGYLLARPAAADVIGEWLRSRRRGSRVLLGTVGR